MAKSVQHKAHKPMGMMQINHPQFGKGLQVTVELSDEPRYRVQLPGKYVAQFCSEDIQELKKAMTNGANPTQTKRETTRLKLHTFAQPTVQQASSYERMRLFHVPSTYPTQTQTK